MADNEKRKQALEVHGRNYAEIDRGDGVCVVAQEFTRRQARALMQCLGAKSKVIRPSCDAKRLVGPGG
jgi:hypothetical protein